MLLGDQRHLAAELVQLEVHQPHAADLHPPRARTVDAREQPPQC